MHIEILDPDELYNTLQKIQANPEIQKKSYFFFDNPIKVMLDSLLRQGRGLFQNQNDYLPKREVKSIK